MKTKIRFGKKERKSLNWALIGLFLLFGAIVSIPFISLTSNIEKFVCENKALETQTDIEGTLLCSKISNEEARTVWRAYCDKGTLRSINKYESCIKNILFFPMYPISEDSHPDSGMLFIYILPLYGAIVGGIIGFIIALFIKIFRRKNEI